MRGFNARSSVGRTCSAIQSEHENPFSFALILTMAFRIDADMPVECDDQYWKFPPGRDQPVEFAQPHDTPSLVAAFNRQIVLCRLLSKAKKIFKVNVEDQRSQEALAKINMGLNEWLDRVPEHRECCFFFFSEHS